MRSLPVMIAFAAFVAVLGLTEGMDGEARTFPGRRFTAITDTISPADGFGFGAQVVPIGGTLPGPPTGAGHPFPFDAPDSPCAFTRTWTHDISAKIPEGAVVVSALLTVNVAGIEPDKFQSLLTADSTVFPLGLFDQGSLGSGLIPIPLNPHDLQDGLLKVTILKGSRLSGKCDDQFYDFSTLTVTYKIP